MNIVDVNEANQGNKNVDFLLMNMTRSCRYFKDSMEQEITHYSRGKLHVGQITVRESACSTK